MSDLVLIFTGAEPCHVLLEEISKHAGAAGVDALRSIIEVGCGSGKLSTHLAVRLGCDATLIDVDKDMVDYAEHLSTAARHVLAASNTRPGGRVVTKAASGFLLPFPSEAYDLAWDEGVIEHWPRENQLAFLSEMARVSREWVCFIVPDAAHPESQRIARDVTHHYEDMPEHEQPLTEADCRSLATDAGLEVLTLRACMERFHFVLCRKPKAQPVAAVPEVAPARAEGLGVPGAGPGSARPVDAIPIPLEAITRRAQAAGRPEA